MSIEDPKVIDFVSAKDAGPVVLTISDHLGWDDEGRHLLAIQDKLNGYLEYIQGGQLEERHPDARERGIKIEIVAKNLAPPTVGHFFQHVDEALRNAGYSFEYRQLREEHRGAA